MASSDDPNSVFTEINTSTLRRIVRIHVPWPSFIAFGIPNPFDEFHPSSRTFPDFVSASNRSDDNSVATTFPHSFPPNSILQLINAVYFQHGLTDFVFKQIPVIPASTLCHPYLFAIRKLSQHLYSALKDPDILSLKDLYSSDIHHYFAPELTQQMAYACDEYDPLPSMNAHADLRYSAHSTYAITINDIHKINEGATSVCYLIEEEMNDFDITSRSKRLSTKRTLEVNLINYGNPSGEGCFSVTDVSLADSN